MFWGFIEIKIINMMGREFEKILKSKLYETKPPSDFIPDWNRFLEFKRKKELEQKRRVLGIVLRFAAGFTILFGVGLGVYQFAFRDTVSNELAVVTTNVETTPDNGITESREILPENLLIEPETNQESVQADGSIENIGLSAQPSLLSEVSTKNLAEAASRDLAETSSIMIPKPDPSTISGKQPGTRETQVDALVVNGQIEINSYKTENTEIRPYTLGPQLIAGFIVEKESIQTKEQTISSYDIDEYLREFSELYPEEGEKVPAKWSTGLFANALASNVTGLVADKDYSIGNDYANTKYFNTSYNTDALWTNCTFTSANGVIASAEQLYYNKPLKHNPPLTLSATASWAVTPKIELESGLVYTYLYSYYDEYSNFNSYSQKVHYLGIPLSVAFNYLPEKSKFDIYNIGGILAEKCLSATGVIKSYQNSELQEYEMEKIKSPHIMLSANIGLGIGYDIFTSLGLFAESYVSYYILDEDQPVTFKTENKFNMNLRLGVRYKFNTK